VKLEEEAMENNFLNNQKSQEKAAPLEQDGLRAPGLGLQIDQARLMMAILRRWKFIAACMLVCGSVAGVAAIKYFHAKHVGSVQIMLDTAQAKYAQDATADYVPTPIPEADLENIMRSPLVLKALSEKTGDDAGKINKNLKVEPVRGTDIINITYQSSVSDEDALKVLNAYTEQFLSRNQEMIKSQAEQAIQLMELQLSSTTNELEGVNAKLAEFRHTADSVDVNRDMDAYMRERGDLDSRLQQAQMDAQMADMKIKLLASELLDIERQKLKSMSTSLSDTHPEVLAEKDLIAELESQTNQIQNGLAPAPTYDVGASSYLYQQWIMQKSQKQTLTAQIEALKQAKEEVTIKIKELSKNSIQFGDIIGRHQTLLASVETLKAHIRQARLYAEKGISNYQLIPGQVGTPGGLKTDAFMAGLSLIGILLGAFAGAVISVASDLSNQKVITTKEAQVALHLPCIGALHDVQQATRNWAFRVWTAIQAQENKNVPGCIGVTSTKPNEGRSTLVHLLTEAASMTTQNLIVLSNSTRIEKIKNYCPSDIHNLELAMALSAPKAVTNGAPTCIALPEGWAWNLDTRKKALKAISAWREQGYTTLIELPAADDPETTILGENCTSIVWVVESGRSTKKEIAEAASNLRTGHCKLSAFVLNRAPKMFNPAGQESRNS
jgi:capsular polysaccharide biosynthesis protein